MLIAAIACFLVAIVIGFAVFAFVLQGLKVPKYVSIPHGLFALAGITLLVIYAVQHEQGPLAGLVILVIAALAGLMLFYKDLTGKPVPAWMAMLHGVVAFAGFMALAIYLILISA